jgi:hypothetical protein
MKARPPSRHDSPAALRVHIKMLRARPRAGAYSTNHYSTNDPRVQTAGWAVEDDSQCLEVRRRAEARAFHRQFVVRSIICVLAMLALWLWALTAAAAGT